MDSVAIVVETDVTRAMDARDTAKKLVEIAKNDLFKARETLHWAGGQVVLAKAQAKIDEVAAERNAKKESPIG